MDLTLRQCKSCTVADAIIVAIIGTLMAREGESERFREREKREREAGWERERGKLGREGGGGWVSNTRH